MALTFNLTALSDMELENLSHNAARLSQSGSQAQQDASVELLPKIAEEVSRRIDALQVKRAATREISKKKAAATRARKAGAAPAA